VFTRATAEATKPPSGRTGKRWVVGTMVLAGGLVAAACGSSSPSKSSSAATTTTSPSPSSPKKHSTTTTTAPSATTTTTAAGTTTPTTTATGTTTPATSGGTTTPATTKTATPATTKTTTPATSAAASNALGGSNDFNTPAVALTGAGSTFDQPLFARQFFDFNHDDSKVTVNYASVGSGTGESDILAGTVNFGASDVPEPSTTTGSGGAILQVPVVLGGIAMAYNAPCPNNVHLTGVQIAQIYAGKITNWSSIPGCTAMAIETVHRADSSGTSNAFTHYMTSVDPTDWPASLDGKQPTFPNGEGGNGNAGVAGDVQGGAGTIGYVELAYALQSGLHYAAVENSSGAFVVPTAASVAADAAAFPGVTADNYLIVNGSGAGAYPISTYSWVIVYQKQSNTNDGLALGKMLDWMATAGQSDAGAIGYVPLPSNVQSLAIATIMKMENSSGQPLFS
jgi:phosphate transport system substrate-binding protein